MIYDPKKHHRQSIRLKGYDYSQAGLYFITICNQDRAHLFGYIENGEMILNTYGQIAHEEWGNTANIRDNCRIHEFIIMPNHIHGIIEILFKKEEENEIGKFQSPFQTISSIIRGFKIATIKKIKDLILKEAEKEKKEREIDLKGGNNKKEEIRSTGELQFAPTALTPTEKIKSLDFKIWQRNYYEHIIRTENAYQRISEYIINNPKKWKTDKLR